jgi:DNA-binding SARP family transcriptional activator
MHVSVLGESAITDESGSIRTRSSRAVVLVAFLAFHAGSPQPRQRIAALFWPDSTDAQALTNLRRELHYLRQILPDDPSLVVTSRDLCWHDAATCRVDLRVFETEWTAAARAAADGDDEGLLEHGAAALAEYRGDLLPSGYDDWLLEARAELKRRCVDLCDLLCAARIRTGDLARAVDAVRRRLQLEPLEESGYRTLMRLQADLGDRAGAVSTYHHCASVLERELGVVPDAATRTAFQRLIAHARPADGAQADGAQAAGGPGRAPGRLGPGAVPLIGRSAELGALEGVWRAAVAGEPRMALVQGGAGVGKTRLVAELAQLARAEGAVVAGTRCFGASGRLALAPVADWLRNPAVQSAAVTLDPAWRAEVGRLVPAGGRGSGTRALADAWQRHRFFEGLARALHAVGRPLLLVLDNMQWCDQETLAFVTFCLTWAEDAQLLVAGTARGDGLGDSHELADWTVRMRATGLLTELPLSPLEAADTARLARAVSGVALAEADADLLHATTGGFPLFVIEALRGSAGLRGAPPPAGDLSGVLRGRLLEATGPAREVAGLAAAVGTNFSLDLLTEASDLDADAVVTAVDELWRMRIMREFGEGYDFSHDLLRETAYAEVSPPKRWLLHRRIAQSLELLHAGGTDAVAAQLAEQYSRGGRPERAVHFYRRAADVAAGMFGHDEAIRLHKKALAIVAGMPAGRDRDARELEILEQVAAPLNAKYGYSSLELQRTLERSIILAEELGRRDSVVNGLTAMWSTRFVQGRISEGYRLSLRALELVEPESELSALAHFGVGGSAVSLGMPADALRHLALAARGALSLVIGTRADVHGTAWSAHAHWLLGHGDEALSSCQEAIELARAIGHPYSLAVALAYGSITRQMRHDTRELRDYVGELHELCERYGFGYYREWALVLDGWSQPDGSGADLAWRGIGNLRSQGSLARMPYWLSLAADVSARAGRPDQARVTLDAAIATAHAHDDVWWLPEVLRMRAAYDDEQAAAARLRAAAELASAHGSAELLRRCELDLAGRGVRPRAPSVLPSGLPSA